MPNVVKYQAIRRPLNYLSTGLFHAFLVFHLLMSPVLIIFAAARGILNGSFFMFLTIFLSSLFLGRAFCGWVCPATGLQEIIAQFIRKKTQRNWMIYLKFGISGVWLLAIVVLYLCHGVQRVDLTYGFSDIGLRQKIWMTLGATLILLPFGLLWGRWASCRYLCWIAPLMILGRIIQRKVRTPALQVVFSQDKCTDCKLCERHCPMNLELDAASRQGSVGDMDCILCGNCIDACKSGALRYGLPSFGKHP